MLRCNYMCNQPPYQKLKDINSAFKYAHDRAFADNRTLVLKYSIDGLEKASDLLKSLKSRVVVVQGDLLKCQIERAEMSNCW